MRESERGPPHDTLEVVGAEWPAAHHAPIMALTACRAPSETRVSPFRRVPRALRGPRRVFSPPESARIFLSASSHTNGGGAVTPYRSPGHQLDPECHGSVHRRGPDVRLYCRHVLSRDDPGRRRFASGRAKRASAWRSRPRGCAARRGEPRPPWSRRHVGRARFHVEPAEPPAASRNVEGINGARRRSRILVSSRVCVIRRALSSPGPAKAAQACLHRATLSS